jgi:glycosyltransferase involved in cell wall biosynthesis
LRRLRVLFCTWNYHPSPAGGAEKQAKLQAEELVRRGHDVTVVCPKMPGTTSGFINGVRVERLRRLYKRPGQRLSYLAAIVIFAARNLRRYDLVHIHLANLQTEVLVPLALMARRPVYAKVACGGEVGEVARFRRVAKVTRWFGLKHAARVQALSAEIESELLSIGITPKRIERIPNGVDLSAFRPALPGERAALKEALSLPQEKVVVLFAGRFARYKGLDDLLCTWAQIDVSGAELVLLGGADTDAPLEVGVLPAGVQIRDYAHNVAEYFRAADIFVYPSYADGMSNAVLEALASGIAVAASRSGATAEVVEHERSALLFEAGDRDALLETLESLIHDPGLRFRLGEEGREAVEGFGIPAVVDRIERSYREMVQKGC